MLVSRRIKEAGGRRRSSMCGDVASDPSFRLGHAHRTESSVSEVAPAALPPFKPRPAPTRRTVLCALIRGSSRPIRPAMELGYTPVLEDAGGARTAAAAPSAHLGGGDSAAAAALSRGAPRAVGWCGQPSDGASCAARAPRHGKGLAPGGHSRMRSTLPCGSAPPSRASSSSHSCTSHHCALHLRACVFARRRTA